MYTILMNDSVLEFLPAGWIRLILKEQQTLILQAVSQRLSSFSEDLSTTQQRRESLLQEQSSTSQNLFSCLLNSTTTNSDQFFSSLSDKQIPEEITPVADIPLDSVLQGWRSWLSPTEWEFIDRSKSWVTPKDLEKWVDIPMEHCPDVWKTLWKQIDENNAMEINRQSEIALLFMGGAEEEQLTFQMQKENLIHLQKELYEKIVKFLRNYLQIVRHQHQEMETLVDKIKEILNRFTQQIQRHNKSLLEKRLADKNQEIRDKCTEIQEHLQKLFQFLVDFTKFLNQWKVCVKTWIHRIQNAEKQVEKIAHMSFRVEKTTGGKEMFHDFLNASLFSLLKEQLLQENMYTNSSSTSNFDKEDTLQCLQEVMSILGHFLSWRSELWNQILVANSWYQNWWTEMTDTIQVGSFLPDLHSSLLNTSLFTLMIEEGTTENPVVVFVEDEIEKPQVFPSYHWPVSPFSESEPILDPESPFITPYRFSHSSYETVIALPFLPTIYKDIFPEGSLQRLKQNMELSENGETKIKQFTEEDRSLQEQWQYFNTESRQSSLSRNEKMKELIQDLQNILVRFWDEINASFSTDEILKSVVVSLFQSIQPSILSRSPKEQFPMKGYMQWVKLVLVLSLCQEKDKNFFSKFCLTFFPRPSESGAAESNKIRPPWLHPALEKTLTSFLPQNV